jgi:RimJ/RimL family protein N-acetyltransferase
MPMNAQDRWEAAWLAAVRRFRAFEPTVAELARFASPLAAYYNEPHNRAMMANTVDMTAGEVVQHWHALWADGGRPFLLELDGEIVGDADFRHVCETSAEFAILVGRRSEQGRGLGLRFGILLHAWAFRALGLQRIYASIIPANIPSQRLFARLGYLADDTSGARAFADEASDLTFSVGHTEFSAKHGGLLGEIECRKLR